MRATKNQCASPARCLHHIVNVDTSRRQRVVRVLEHVRELAGTPESIRLDTEPEFVAQLLEAWTAERQIRLDFTTPSKPTEHGHIESFNGKFRDACVRQR